MNKIKKKRIRNSFLIVISVILVLIILNLVYIKIVLPKKVELRKNILYTDFIDNLTDKKLSFAFFGDSHCLRSLNPEHFPGSYNYCNTGKSYVGILRRLNNTFKSESIKIDNIVLQLDLHTLSSFRKRKSSKNMDLLMIEAEDDLWGELTNNHNYSYTEIFLKNFSQ